MKNEKKEIERLSKALEQTKTLIIGAGAGLSASAGFSYTGERFEKYFHDFSQKYHFRDMYSGGFCSFESEEEFWAYWSRYIFINRYMDAPIPVYERLLQLVKDKNYFVITTNVDHCFQKAGFDKQRLFYTQGDYGLFQCSEPCHPDTYDNKDVIQEMVTSQGYEIQDGILIPPEDKPPEMKVPSDLIPHCPRCGKIMTMNLRSDDTFVEDEGWHRAARRYRAFLEENQGKSILFLELGVGGNTPGIIKYPFWQMTLKNPKAVYACLNYSEAYAPREIREQSICISGDAGEILNQL